MIPTNDLPAAERSVLRRTLAIAREAFERNRVDVARPCRRFRAEVRYDDRTHHLAASAVHARSDHGTIAAVSDAKRFKLELQPFNERAKTPLVVVESLRPRDLDAPIPDRDAILSEIDRLLHWANGSADPNRFYLRARLSALLGAQLQQDGLPTVEGEYYHITLGNQWRAGTVWVEGDLMLQLSNEQHRILRSFTDRNRDLITQILGVKQNFEISSSVYERSGRTRIVFDMTSQITIRAVPTDPLEAMRRIAA